MQSPGSDCFWSQTGAEFETGNRDEGAPVCDRHRRLKFAKAGCKLALRFGAHSHEFTGSHRVLETLDRSAGRRPGALRLMPFFAPDRRSALRRMPGFHISRTTPRNPEPNGASNQRGCVLDCGSPRPLSGCVGPSESARGLAHSKTFRQCGRFMKKLNRIG